MGRQGGPILVMAWRINIFTGMLYQDSASGGLAVADGPFDFMSGVDIDFMDGNAIDFMST